ncbi:hypothetical protein [Porphyrobacter sp. ULC335]|uniref:hypothetical protein n=1 Tax=Porphyrobacter sp. ULC335 TaxID=2854260 RepID=UPI00221E8DB4|nr:hypothetical protein [Porphyrobacter sp. ULC335]UYV15342.1 hypothetical protein KVF90_14665 [Porphyrobacter sp. ULC335]
MRPTRVRLGALLAGLALCAGLAGCKPPPTDAAVARVSLDAPTRGPSAPIPSPDTTGAVWASTANPLRLVYGIPGQPVLLAIECLSPATPEAKLRITRHAPADEGASALLALIGNGWIGRFPVDATEIAGKSFWQGDVPAGQREWTALKPEREATVTVPGAGLVRLNPSPLPMALVEACRGEPPKLPPVETVQFTPELSPIP